MVASHTCTDFGGAPGEAQRWFAAPWDRAIEESAGLISPGVEVLRSWILDLVETV